MTQLSPPWLKAMQNGSLGEARAKAFLLDRFWILERSVDIEGADLIIQMRLTNRNLLDPMPPKLGFVQVKFFESEKTIQYIPKAYIIDQDGNPRPDFFLLFHTGYEENSKMYFLTSNMINLDFTTIEKAGIEKYRIYGKNILNSEKYLVKSRSNTLNRMENNLAFADFKKNREFISWKLPNVNSDTSGILPFYKEDIDNHWGNIPEEFQKIKNHALKSMNELEDIYLRLKEIADEIDPIEAFIKIEDLKGDIGSQYFGNWGKRMFDNLFNEDFYYASVNHKEKIETLTSDGILDDYLNIKTALADYLVPFLTRKFPIDPDLVHTIQITFSLSNFKIEDVKQQLINAVEYFEVPFKKLESGKLKIDSQYYSGIKRISDNKLEYYWLTGRFQINDIDKNNLANFYRLKINHLYRDCAEKMFEIKYHN